ncbi:hypothetical protein KEU06_09325 [Pseudaminobacter sp. 19-2017]|uniref:Terminase small subunit n=1 Tax=Pseudaminobacter soli (ex Zhang et al. 2022) TaxID=2831468 RepID=A0A942E0U6_9HYPH|nr:hypothetical protein [Pseudaminobacter soli]MBS3648805.1 hypothetical protein [Pseudaminobacter soli]
MPVLSNPKWEVFATGLADGLTVLDAYEQAGYPRSASSASQLKNRPELQSRVQELIYEKQSAARRESENDPDINPHELNRAWLITTLMKNVEIAQKAQQIAPANKAVEMLAEIIGYSLKNRGGKNANDDDPNKDGEAPGFDFDKANDAIGRLMEVLPDAPTEGS